MDEAEWSAARSRASSGGPEAGNGVAGKRRRLGGFDAEWEDHFVRSVRAAATAAYEQAAWEPPQRAYLVLAGELAARGIDPEPGAVFDAAMLISRGRRPAVLDI